MVHVTARAAPVAARVASQYSIDERARLPHEEVASGFVVLRPAALLLLTPFGAYSHPLDLADLPLPLALPQRQKSLQLAAAAAIDAPAAHARTSLPLQRYMLPEHFLNQYWFLDLSLVDSLLQQQMLRIFLVLQK